MACKIQRKTQCIIFFKLKDSNFGALVTFDKWVFIGLDNGFPLICNQTFY